jgi:uncharacterized protein (DUF924 family)
MLTDADGDGRHSSGDDAGRGRHDPAAVLAFWFAPGNEVRWFGADPGFDAEIARRFTASVEAARRRELDGWAATPDGALALCLLLDQFPRNIWRGTPRAYSCDDEARRVAADAIAAGHDRAVPPERRPFFYLPYEHSEDLADQERCVALMRGLNDREQLLWAERHHAVIARFGRFPHRNIILGRMSSPEELAFLGQPGSAF